MVSSTTRRQHQIREFNSLSACLLAWRITVVRVKCFGGRRAASSKQHQTLLCNEQRVTFIYGRQTAPHRVRGRGHAVRVGWFWQNHFSNDSQDSSTRHWSLAAQTEISYRANAVQSSMVRQVQSVHVNRPRHTRCQSDIQVTAIEFLKKIHLSHTRKPAL